MPLRRWRIPLSFERLWTILGAGAALAMMGVLPVRATTATFTGNTSTSWTVGTNWIGGVVPNASGDTADISGTPSRTTMAMGASNITLGNLTFNTTSNMIISGTGDLVIQNTTTGAGGITLSNSGSLNIKAEISLSSDLYVNNNGTAATTLTMSGGIVTAAGNDLFFSGSGCTTISGSAITGAGNMTVNGGTVTVNVNSTYTGNTTVNGGALELNKSLTTGNVLVTGGNFDYTASNKLSDTTNVTVSGGNYNLDTFKDTINNLALTGGQVTGSGTLTGGNYDMESGSASVVLAGAANLTKSTAATVTLSGVNTYTGSTKITGGTLSVSTLANGGTASGIGQSTAAAANLVIDGGTLQYTGGTASTNQDFTLGASGGALDASGTGAVTFSNTTAMAFTGNGARTLTLTGSNTSANTLAVIVGDASAGNATSLTKSGVGEWVLTGNNTFTGTTTVSGGTLVLQATGANGALGNTSSIIINSGGTLLLGASNQINGAGAAAAVGLTLSGGTFATGGFSQGNNTLGALTLSSNSTINLGGGASITHVGNTSAQGWTGGTKLYVTNWNGTIGSGGGTDQLYFGNTSSGLTIGQLQQIIFVSPNGLSGNYFGEILSTGEVVAFRPVPEPGTYAAGGLLTVLAVGWEWRRRRGRGNRAKGKVSERSKE
jgi:autotransporter-associated beta strand protein